jgi:amino acid transporter
MPILALGCAALWERIGAGTAAIIAGWTLMLVVHGAAFPWRLFHLATGENFLGESLSERWHSDFSRLMPSFIRPNVAATVASVALIAAICIAAINAVILSRRRTVEGPPADQQSSLRHSTLTALAPLIVATLLLAAFTYGRKPGGRVDLEDAHVVHGGGEVFPSEWTVSRFLYQGGWTVRAGDALSFLAKPGPSTLRYQSRGGATIEIGGHAFVLPATGSIYGFATVNIGAAGRAELRCLDGSATLDWIQHD